MEGGPRFVSSTMFRGLVGESAWDFFYRGEMFEKDGGGEGEWGEREEGRREGGRLVVVFVFFLVMEFPLSGFVPFPAEVRRGGV